MKRWIRKLFPAKSQTENQSTRTKHPIRPHRNLLRLEELEPWIAPDSTNLGGLTFTAPGALANTPVTVTAQNETTPLLRFSGGVNLVGDTFTPVGIVSAISGSNEVQVLNTGVHAPIRPAELLGNGVTIAASQSNGVAVAVPGTGTQLTVGKLQIAGNAGTRFVNLGGTVGFSEFSGLRFSLPESAAVKVDSSRVQYTNTFSISVPPIEFEVKKLTIKTDQVTVAYDNVRNSFAFSGGVSVTNNSKTKILDNVAARFGDASSPGFVITDGKLASVDIAISGGFMLYGLKVSADNLRVKFDIPTGSLQLSGGLNVILSNNLGFGASLNQPLAIDTNTGQVTLPNGLDISGSLKLGSFETKVTIQYITDAALGYTLKASAVLTLTTFEIGGSFTIVNGELTAVSISYAAVGANPGIALGNTGLFLTAFSGGLSNLNTPSKIEVTGSLTVVFGKKITIAGTDYAIFDAQGSFTITPEKLRLEGSVNLVGGVLGKGKATVDINWVTGKYNLKVDAEFLFIFRFNGDLAFDNAGNITLSASAAVRIPDRSPVFPGVTLAKANVYVQIRPSLSSDLNFVAVWGSLGLFDLGVQIAFDGSISLLTGPPEMTPPVNDQDPLRGTQFPHTIDREITVPYDPGIQGFLVTMNNDKGVAPFSEFVTINVGQDNTYVFNDQSTIGPQLNNESFVGDAKGTKFYNYELRPTDGERLAIPIPHEKGLTALALPGEDGKLKYDPNKRTFHFPQKYIPTSPTNPRADYKIGVRVSSRIEYDAKTNPPPTFTVSTLYQSGSARAFLPTVDRTSGVTTIRVNGFAFGDYSKQFVNVYRFEDGTNVNQSVLVSSVRLSDLVRTKDPNGFYDIRVPWNGIVDLATNSTSIPRTRFFARLNDGGNALNQGTIQPGSLGLTEFVSGPNPFPNVVLQSPSGFIPGTSTRYVTPVVDSTVPSGFSATFGSGGPTLEVRELNTIGTKDILPLKTDLSIEVKSGGFVGIGKTADIANSKVTILSKSFNSRFEATTYLGQLKFVANESYSGESIITITATTTSPSGAKFKNVLTVPIIQTPFFLDPSQTSVINGTVGVDLTSAQLAFAKGFESVGPYTFQVVSGNLRGLTVSRETGAVFGRPTSASPGTSPETITIAAYDKFGNATSQSYNLRIVPNLELLNPRPVDDIASTNQVVGIFIPVLQNDFVPQEVNRKELTPLVGAATGATTVQAPQHGTVTTKLDPVTGANALFYVPNGTYLGTDTFEYILDKDGTRRVGKVSVTVTNPVVDLATNDFDINQNPGRLTLRQAILLSNATPGKQTITFSPEVFSTPQTITLDKSALVVTDDLTILGPGADLLTINGNGADGTGVFFFGQQDAPKITGIIRGLTITNGMRGNGGGIFNLGNLTVEDCIITGNSTVPADGFPAGDGGGILNLNGALEIINCTISNNSASTGGGIVSIGTDPMNYTTSLVIRNSTITGNTAFGSGTSDDEFGGGGIHNFQTTATLTNVTISDNYAAHIGGGIGNFGILTITNGTIILNGADSDNNLTDDAGGGILRDKRAANTVTLYNTIVAGNVVNATRENRGAEVANDITAFLPLDSRSSFNLIGDPASAGGLIDAKNGNIVGDSGQLRRLPTILDGLLRANGGLASTYGLLETGPAVNAGSNSNLPVGVEFDQRGIGFPRVIAGTVDIGATELDTVSLRVSTITDSDDDNAVLPNETLTYTVTFNQDIDAASVTAADFANLGTAPITIGTITAISPSVFTVTITPTAVGSVVLQIPATAVITSTSGQPLIVPARDTDLINASNPPPPPNTLPVATDITTVIATAADSTIKVLVNDRDTDGDLLTVSLRTSPQFGTATVNADQTVSYVPIAGFLGNDTFEVAIADSKGGTAVSNVTVTVTTVNPTNRNPVANAVTATALTAAPSSFNVIVSDADNDPLNISAITQPRNGFASANGQRIIYTSNSNFVGVDTFSYTVIDGRGGSATGNVTLTVSATPSVNTPPVAIADKATTAVGTPITFPVRANDFDADGDTLRITEVLNNPNHGTATNNNGDTITFTPNAGFVGITRVVYRISDGRGGEATEALDITVTGVVPQPTNPALLVGYKEFAAGTDVGGASAALFNTDGSSRFSVSPFPGFSGGIRTAAADFNNDGVADLVVGTGPGRATRVRILDGTSQAELFAVDPFEAAFTGGVYVAVGDVNGDGVPDLAITPDEGGGPRVDVYSGAAGFPKIVSFFGIDDPNFRGGARAAIADMTGDGAADLIVVAGFGGGPRVAGFDGRSLSSTPRKIFGDFFAFEQGLRNGIFVTVGDLNGDGKADLIAGGGPGGGPRVLAFDGANLIQNQYVNLANFFGGNPDNRGGIRLTVKDLDGDSRADLVVGSGAGAGSRVTSYLGKNIGPSGTPASNLDFDALSGFTGGVFVG